MGTDIDTAQRILAAAERVTVLTGAGISTSSGIPDFRGPQGVWTKDPTAQQVFTLQNYLADSAIRERSWRMRRDNAAWTAEPTAGHRALVDLERAGRLRAIVTQNIDGLHQKAGSSTDRVIEIHGTMWWVTCMSCADRTPTPEVLERLDAGETDPDCRECGGILKTATISFGQALDEQVMDAAIDAARDCEVLLAVGSSLQVYPAAGLCDLAQGAGARLVVVNAEPTPYDGGADAVVRDPIDQVLPTLVSASG
ncbi:MAG: NAD-dependent deacetylase [Actinomycetota bacterium]|nr:NAD-dependent deacetylase [Actinomycetota bacterium]